jgi:hypothetical protein
MAKKQEQDVMCYYPTDDLERILGNRAVVCEDLFNMQDISTLSPEKKEEAISLSNKRYGELVKYFADKAKRLMEEGETEMSGRSIEHKTNEALADIFELMGDKSKESSDYRCERQHLHVLVHNSYEHAKKVLWDFKDNDNVYAVLGFSIPLKKFRKGCAGSVGWMIKQEIELDKYLKEVSVVKASGNIDKRLREIRKKLEEAGVKGVRVVYDPKC